MRIADFGTSVLSRLRPSRVASVLGLVAAVGVLQGCIIVHDRFERMSAGVLTTKGGTEYLVLSPCASFAVESIALYYVPAGAELFDDTLAVPVLAYSVDPDVLAAEVFGPLHPDRVPVPAGLTLETVDEPLLARALESEQPAGWGDNFYVEASGTRSDGTEKHLSGGWWSTQSSPNSVVLLDEVRSDADRYDCGSSRARWSIPADPAQTIDDK